MPYTPIVLVVEHGNHILKEEPAILTHAHVDAMIIILEKYDEQYQEENGILLIKKTLQDDHDLLQNYTSKAEAYRLSKQQ